MTVFHERLLINAAQVLYLFNAASDIAIDMNFVRSKTRCISHPASSDRHLGLTEFCVPLFPKPQARGVRTSRTSWRLRFDGLRCLLASPGCGRGALACFASSPPAWRFAFVADLAPGGLSSLTSSRPHLSAKAPFSLLAVIGCCALRLPFRQRERWCAVGGGRLC